MNMTGIDPLTVLAHHADPAARAWAVRELTAAGFVDAAAIERDLRGGAR